MKREFIGIMGKLVVESAEDDGNLILTMSGEADVYTSDDMAKLVGGFIDGGKTAIILDFSSLTYLDSSTLSRLLSLQKKVKAAGGRIVLMGLAGEPLKVFQLSGFTELFTIVDDLQAAREFLS